MDSLFELEPEIYVWYGRIFGKEDLKRRGIYDILKINNFFGRINTS